MALTIPSYQPMRFFDKDGTPIDVVEWGRKYEDKDYCTVARDEVHGWHINTMWTGGEGSLGILGLLSGLPRTYGTMPIFGTGAVLLVADEPIVLELWVYPTMDAAQAGHRRIVDWMCRPGTVPLLCGTTMTELFREAA